MHKHQPGSGIERASLLTLDDLFWFLYLYPLRILSALSPQELIYRLGGLFQFRAKQRRELAARRILTARSAGITREDAPRIARQLLANSKSRLLDDLVLSWPSCRRKLRCAGIEGFEHLERAVASGRGAIVLTAHFCATRVAKRYLATIGYPMLTVRDHVPPEDWWGRVGRRILEPRRRKFLSSVIGEAVYVQDRSCTLKILQRLRSAGLVHIHFDGRSGKKSTLWPFLGVPRSFSTGVFELVRLSGCSVIPMLCLGRSSAFRIIFDSTLDIVQASEREEFVRANLPTFVESIEKQIRDYPEEWEEWMSF
jgi:Kdo2-lipid IVA lauroyltransferase/acyltransferase